MVLAAGNMRHFQALIAKELELSGFVLDGLLACFWTQATFTVKGTTPGKNFAFICQSHCVEE